MLFSVIIPAFNEEQSLPACLESLKRQSIQFADYEIIVIDNGSTDRTREIAQEYGAQLIINTHKNVSGLRNLGAEIAQGEILAFIDADCTASEDWLNNASKYISEKTISAWGAAPGVPDDATWVQKSWLNLRRKTEELMTVDWLESMNLFVRKETFFSISGFNEALITCEDVDFCYRVGEKGNLISDNNIKVVHMGEAETLKEFIKKEFWRGTSSYQGLLSHGLKLSELPSLLVPLYFSLFLPVSIFLAMTTEALLFHVLAIAAVIIPGIAVWLKLYKKKLTGFELLQLQILIHIYFFVRSISAFKGLLISDKK